MSLPVPPPPPPPKGKYRWHIRIGAAAAIIAAVWYFSGSPPFEPTNVQANQDGWPPITKPDPRPPSLADAYDKAGLAPPAVVKASDSDGQKAVAVWVEKLGLMPSVKGTVKDKRSDPRHQLVPGEDKFKVLTTTTYDNLAQIDEILTLVSRVDVYPARFVQGASLSEGLPVAIRVPEAKRAELTYVLLGATPDALPKTPGSDPQSKGANLPTKQFLELARSKTLRPSLAAADAVRKELMRDVKLPAHYSKNLTHAYSAEHLRTQLGVAANFLAGSAKLNVATSTKQEKAMVVLLLRQEYFKIAVDAPRVADWFTPEITVDDFSKAEVSAQNKPCFISSVGYGRVVMLMAESESNHLQVAAALSAAYSGGFTKLTLDANVDYKRILESTTFRLTVYGGDPANATAKPVGPDAKSVGPLNVKEFKGIDGLAEMANLVTPDFDARFALPISYEARNLADNRPVAIAAVSAHDITNESSADYRYQVRVDRMDIKDTFRKDWLVFNADGEFHLDVTDQSGKAGTVSKKCGGHNYPNLNMYTPVRNAPKKDITLTLALRERGNGKGTKTLSAIDLAALSDPKKSEHSIDLGEHEFDNRNKVWLTLIAIPPELPKE